jgi:hypothetical protein
MILSYKLRPKAMKILATHSINYEYFGVSLPTMLEIYGLAFQRWGEGLGRRIY